MKKIPFPGFLIWFVSYCGVAQVCPTSIESTTQIKNKPIGWDVVPNSKSHYLYSISIIEGSISQSDDTPPAQLVPEFVGDAQYWKFANPVGNSEMWMICGYAGTPLVLKSRIRPDVIECFVTPVSNPKARDKNEPRVRGLCISAAQKSKR